MERLRIHRPEELQAIQPLQQCVPIGIILTDLLQKHEADVRVRQPLGRTDRNAYASMASVVRLSLERTRDMTYVCCAGVKTSAMTVVAGSG